MNGTIKKKVNGYNYKYADLAAVHEYLESVGITYYQYTETAGNGQDYIMTVVIDKDGKESAPRRGARLVEATLQGKSNPAQEYGSSLTYARRYSLLMALGLATEDDDAESLTTEQESKPEDERVAIGKAIIEYGKKHGMTKEEIKKDYNLNGASAERLKEVYKDLSGVDYAG